MKSKFLCDKQVPEATFDQLNLAYDKLRDYTQEELVPTVLQLSQQNIVELVTPKTIVRPYSFAIKWILLNVQETSVLINTETLTFKNGKLQPFNNSVIALQLAQIKLQKAILFGYLEKNIYGNWVYIVTEQISKENYQLPQEQIDNDQNCDTPSQEFFQLQNIKGRPVSELRTLVTELIQNPFPISAIEFVSNKKHGFYPLALLAAHEIYTSIRPQSIENFGNNEEDKTQNLIKLQITSTSTPEVFWVQDSDQNKLGLLYLPSTSSVKFIKMLFEKSNSKKIWCMCKAIELDDETRYMPVPHEINLTEVEDSLSDWSNESCRSVKVI